MIPQSKLNIILLLLLTVNILITAVYFAIDQVQGLAQETRLREQMNKTKVDINRDLNEFLDNLPPTNSDNITGEVYIFSEEVKPKYY